MRRTNERPARLACSSNCLHPCEYITGGREQGAITCSYLCAVGCYMPHAAAGATETAAADQHRKRTALIRTRITSIDRQITRKRFFSHSDTEVTSEFTSEKHLEKQTTYTINTCANSYRQIVCSSLGTISINDDTMRIDQRD